MKIAANLHKTQKSLKTQTFDDSADNKKYKKRK